MVISYLFLVSLQGILLLEQLFLLISAKWTSLKKDSISITWSVITKKISYMINRKFSQRNGQKIGTWRTKVKWSQTLKRISLAYGLVF